MTVVLPSSSTAWRDARAVLAIGRSVTLLSAPGAALFAGCGWWRAVIERARGEFPGVPIDDILDCADAPGLALGALRIGQRRLVLARPRPAGERSPRSPHHLAARC